MDLQDSVLKFCQSLDANVDHAVVEYIIGIIKDAQVDNVDLEEIEDVVTGFFPTFSSFPEERRHDKLWNLVQEVLQASLVLSFPYRMFIILLCIDTSNYSPFTTEPCSCCKIFRDLPAEPERCRGGRGHRTSKIRRDTQGDRAHKGSGVTFPWVKTSHRDLTNALSSAQRWCALVQSIYHALYPVNCLQE